VIRHSTPDEVREHEVVIVGAGPAGMMLAAELTIADVDERHPVAARVMHNTMAQRALQGDDARTTALRETVAGLLALDEPRIRTAAMIAGLDIDHEPDAPHPMIGRRVPDVELVTGTGRTLVSELLVRAEPLLVTLDPTVRSATGDVHGVRIIDAGYDGPWRLPVVGAVEPPAAVLVRPDGYVAWAGTDPAAALADAIDRWFAPPR
jgi:hypothetical protein